MSLDIEAIEREAAEVSTDAARMSLMWRHVRRLLNETKSLRTTNDDLRNAANQSALALAEARMDLERMAKACETAIEDSIRRPMGVVAESAEAALKMIRERKGKAESLSPLAADTVSGLESFADHLTNGKTADEWPGARMVRKPEASGRLAFDPQVSGSSPVVRGTFVTVDHVVELIVNGWTWSDILRTHPEMDEDDIRACLAYAIEAENAKPEAEPEITWDSSGVSSELDGRYAVVLKGIHHWIWIVYRGVTPVPNRRVDTRQAFYVSEHAARDAAEAELRRLAKAAETCPSVVAKPEAEPEITWDRFGASSEIGGLKAEMVTRDGRSTFVISRGSELVAVSQETYAIVRHARRAAEAELRRLARAAGNPIAESVKLIDEGD